MRNKVKKRLLFNPGPTNVSEEVREVLKSVGDVCHREKEFRDVLDRIRSKILKVVNGEGTHTAVAFTASATGCNEAIINSVHGKILLINNGKFSKELGEIAKKYNIPVTELKFDPFKQIDLEKIENCLKQVPEITHILMVHHETETGMIIPLHEIGQLARKYNKILIADTVSSFGGLKIDAKADNLDFCSVSANKCLESFPGVSFVIAKKSELEKLKGKSRNYYFDLYANWESEERKSETPFTPAVQPFFALDKALNLLLEEGPENRIKRYERNAARMRKGLKKLGFKFVLPDSTQSNILTAIWIPKGLDYWELHDRLKERGYTIYSGKSTLDQGIFRIATLGAIGEGDIDSFLKCLKEVLGEMKFEPESQK